ncbi:unnamed protein product [Parajaminaea phylloscopi]
MTSDARFNYSHRLSAASHSIQAIATPSVTNAALQVQPFTVSVNAGGNPSSRRLIALNVDQRGPTSNNLSGYSRGSSTNAEQSSRRRGREQYEFPPTFTDDAAQAGLRRTLLEGLLDEGRARTGGLDASEWNWRQQDVFIRPGLEPVDPTTLPLGTGDDPLPSEQHPCYPFGRPIRTRPPGSHPRASLPNPIQASRAFQNEAAEWNAAAHSNGTAEDSPPSASDASGLRHTDVGPGAAPSGGSNPDALSRPLLTLPAYLARLKTTAIAASTSAPGSHVSFRSQQWPFVCFGPGRNLVRSRAEEDEDDGTENGTAAAVRELWLERDFENLLPRGGERMPLQENSSATFKGSSHLSPCRHGPLPGGGDQDAMDRLLDTVESELAAQQVADASAAAHRGEPVEVRSAEIEATSQLRKLFAGQTRKESTLGTLEAIRSPDSLDDVGGPSGPSAGADRRPGDVAAPHPVPALLLDRYGGDAEELQRLLRRRPRTQESKRQEASALLSATTAAARAGRVPFPRLSTAQPQRTSAVVDATGAGTLSSDFASELDSGWNSWTRRAALQGGQRTAIDEEVEVGVVV